MNRIYYFTGTGNCLKLARDIAQRLGDTELMGIGSGADYKLNRDYERVGIVFPVYYQGLPLAVCDAVRQIDWQSSATAYRFSVATCGAMAGNALAQLARLMEHQGAKLHYGAKLLMFSNCVTLYNMSTKVEETTRQSDMDALPIIEGIAEKQHTPPKRFCSVVDRYYRIQMVPKRDRGFHTDDACTSCAVCEKICPVGNIVMEHGRPVYQHRCEQCLACIQYCPGKAINYKKRTQNRGRYHHPAVSSKDLIESRKANQFWPNLSLQADQQVPQGPKL